MVKVQVTGIGVSWINPAHVIAVLPKLENQQVVVGQAVIVTVNGPPLQVAGNATDIAREMTAPVIELPGGN